LKTDQRGIAGEDGIKEGGASRMHAAISSTNKQASKQASVCESSVRRMRWWRRPSDVTGVF